jgi:hypothetical protein
MNKDLIEQIVLEVLKRIAPISEKSTVDHTKKNLIVYTKKNEGEAYSSNVLEKSWNIITKSVDDEAMPEKIDAVLFLQGSQDLMVKGAIGITDTPETKRLAYHVMMGKNITIVPTEAFKQVIYEDERKVVNNVYRTHLLEYKSTLEKFGVTIEPLSQFEKRLARDKEESKSESHSFSGKLLTEQDVRQHIEETIKVTAKTIITPLARDAARRSGKTIQILDSKGAD